ncbi:hypothetical protein FACS1894189_5170 [Planctomycetales bacterium]|nr:hypothetical protein FACS1894189_5170 [Planctomycetales bacterium]
MNTQNNDDDRYEIYVGMFGDAHLIDKESLSSRIVLSTVKFGWFLVLLYVFVPIALVLLGILLCYANYVLRGDTEAIAALIIGGIVGLLLSCCKKEKK